MTEYRFEEVHLEQVKTIMEAGLVILNGPIDDNVASEVCLALLQIEAENEGKPITLMINSPGGSIQAGWQICDTIEMIGNVEVICTALAASMAALVLMAGYRRTILPHAKVLLHQPLAGASLQQASDFEITCRELSRTRDEVYRYICEHTGKSLAQVTEDCDRDHWLSAQEALDYGIVDKIVYPDDRDEGPIYLGGNI